MGNRVFLYNPLEMGKKELFSVFSSREAQSEYLIDRIREQLNHDAVQHLLIIGPRGSGKTTLLLFLQYKIREEPRLNSSWQIVQFAEEEWGIYSLADFFSWILNKILEEYPESDLADTFDKAKKENHECPGSIEPFTNLIEEFCSRYGKKILLLTDNFDYIIKRNLNDEDRSLLRKYLLFQKQIMIIATAVSLFPEVDDYEEPFFDFFAPVYLQRLSVDQGAELIKRRAEYESGFSLEAERIVDEWESQQSKIRTITELTDGNPRLLLMLYEIMKGNPLGKILEVFNQLLDELTPYLKSVMDQLSNMQSKIVDTLARAEMGLSVSELFDLSGIPKGKLAVQLNRLEEMSFIKREKRKGKTIYVTGNKLFRTWYQMRVVRKKRRIYDLLVAMLNLFYSREEIVGRLESCPPLEEKRHFIAALGDSELKAKYTLQLARDYIKSDSYEEARSEISSIVPSSFSEAVMGLMLLGEGKFDEAEKSFKKGIETGDSQAMYNLAVLYKNQNKLDLAEKYYLLAVEQKYPHAMYNLAVLYEKQNKLDLAEKYYLLAMERKYLKAMNNLAVLYEKQNKLDLAEKYYLLAVEQKDPRAMNNLAVLYEKQNKLDLAEKYYLLAVERKYLKAMNNLAVLYEKQNNLDFAEKYYLLAVEQKYPHAIYNLALLYEKQNKFDLAEKYYLLAVEQKDPEAMYNLAVLYEKQNNLDLSEKYYLLAVEQKDPRALNNLAVLYQSHNKFDLAEKYYLFAVEQKDPKAMYNLAFLYANQNRLDLAEKYYLLAVEQKDPEAMYNLSLLYHNQNKLDLAEKYYLLAVEQKHPSAMNNLAVLYQSQNKLDLAEKYYLLAVEQKHHPSLFNLALLYQSQNKIDLAEKYYFLAMEQKDPQAMNNYAGMLWEQGRIQEAERMYALLLEHKDATFFYKMHFLDFLFSTASIQKIKEFMLSIEKDLLRSDDPNSLLMLLDNILQNEKSLSKFKSLALEMDYSPSESLSFLFPVVLTVAEFHETKNRDKLDQLSSEQKILARILLSSLGYKMDEKMGEEDPALIFSKLSS